MNLIDLMQPHRGPYAPILSGGEFQAPSMMDVSAGALRSGDPEQDQAFQQGMEAGMKAAEEQRWMEEQEQWYSMRRGAPDYQQYRQGERNAFGGAYNLAGPSSMSSGLGPMPMGGVPGAY